MVDEVRVLPKTETMRDRMARVFESRLQKEGHPDFGVKHHPSHDGHTVFVGKLLLSIDGDPEPVEVQTYIYMPDPLVDSGYWDEVFTNHILDRLDMVREALSELGVTP